MVKEVIFNKFLDGQFEEADLTLSDLEKVAEVFIRVLNAMFHTRVDYPKPPANADKKSSEDPDKKPPKNRSN